MLRLLMFLLLILAGSGTWARDNSIASVQTQILSLRPIATSVNCFGLINSSPAALTHVSTKIPGQVVSVLVQKGQRVAKNQPLLILQLDPSVIQSYVQARNQEVLARQELAQQQQLLSAQMATQTDVDRAEQNLHSAELTVRTLKIENADQEQLTIKAPRTGLITQVAFVPGDHVAANSTILNISNEQKLQAVIQVDPEDAQRIATGMKVRLGDVFSVEQNLEGTVELVDHQIDLPSHKVNVWIHLNANTLMEGSAVRARITIASQNLLAVPHAAILQDNIGSFVYRISNGHAHRIAVNVGHEENGWVAVTGDIGVGQHIVVLGNYELQDGMAVNEEVLP